MEVSEQKRQRQLEADRKKLLRQDIARAKEQERSAEKLAQPNVVVEQIDYDARTQKIQAEMEEKTRNLEAQVGEMQDKGFNDIEFIKYDVDFRRLSDFIGISPNELSKFGDELSVIMGWAREQADSDNIVDILQEVKKLKRFLGFQEVGTSAIKKLYQSIRLDLDAKRLSGEALQQVKKEKELLRE